MRMYKICCTCPRHTIFSQATRIRDKQDGDTEWCCAAVDRHAYIWVTTLTEFSKPDDCNFALEHLLESQGCEARY